METVTPDVQAESSPAIEIPRDAAAYAEWRKTGKLPEASARGSQEEAQSSDPAEGEEPKGKTAPASETGNKTQEKNKSQARLNELLADLRDAGLSPAELKKFKDNYQRKGQATETVAAQKPPEQTAKPAELKAPVKPKPEDFKTLDEYEAAKDKYTEELADYRADVKIQQYREGLAKEAQQRAFNEKMEGAIKRYGTESGEVISRTSRAFFDANQNPIVSPAVIAIINDSPVWTDLLYTLGSGNELDSFIQLAKSNPGEAIRKAVLMEQLVKAELAKGGKGKEPAAEVHNTDDGEEETPTRDASGKFQKRTPENKESNAPPPPREVSGRGTPPPDEVERAVKNNDFASYARKKNAEEMQRRRR
jgi:hypothetical protein